MTSQYSPGHILGKGRSIWIVDWNFCNPMEEACILAKRFSSALLKQDSAVVLCRGWGALQLLHLFCQNVRDKRHIGNAAQTAPSCSVSTFQINACKWNANVKQLPKLVFGFNFSEWYFKRVMNDDCLDLDHVWPVPWVACGLMGSVRLSFPGWALIGQVGGSWKWGWWIWGFWSGHFPLSGGGGQFIVPFSLPVSDERLIWWMSPWL